MFVSKLCWKLETQLQQLHRGMNSALGHQLNSHGHKSPTSTCNRQLCEIVLSLK